MKKIGAAVMAIILLGLFGCGKTYIAEETTAEQILVEETTTEEALLDINQILGPEPLTINELAEHFGEPRLPGYPRNISRGPVLVVLCEGIQIELVPPDLSWCYEPELADRTLPMRLYSAIVSGEKFSLPHGIRIGDSVEKVRAAYPDPPYAEPETNDGGMRLVYHYSNGDLGYTFNDGHLSYLLVVWEHLIYSE